ncbi:MAG: DMT family transporter [Alphaproteobacteria bacterium]
MSPNLRGAAFMTLSMASGTVSDTLVKALSAGMNMGQIMLLRGIAATVLIFLLAHHRGALRPLAAAFHPMVVLRSIGEVGATVTFLIALTHVPVADASAIYQSMPLAVTVGAALFLGEPVGWRRWSAILVGFAGVMIIIRPGFEGFSGWSLMILGSVGFGTLRDLATRRIPAGTPSLFISAVTAPAVAVTGAVLVVPLGGWQPVDLGMAAWLVGAAMLLLVNYQFITMAMREGDIAFVSPFRYTGLPFAMLLGFVVFADAPDLPMVGGAAIVVGSGLYMLHRERRLMRRVAVVTRPAPR